MTLAKQYIQLSVFDRLQTDMDYSQQGSTVSDIEIVRKAVLRDVENLLNTRRNIVVPPPSFAYLKDSLFVYGIDDFVPKNPRSPQVKKALLAGIRETIDKFEPRLKEVKVEYRQEEGNSQNLCFLVRAILHAEPVQEPICFDTWFSASRGEYTIDNVK